MNAILNKEVQEFLRQLNERGLVGEVLEVW